MELTFKEKFALTMHLFLAAIVVGSSVGIATSKADYDPGCVQQYWLYGGLFGRGTTRTICDGPIQADGSWLRARSFTDGSRYIPVSCSRYSCSGGYWLQPFKKEDLYIVTPDTILSDEPGHIAQGTLA